MKFKDLKEGQVFEFEGSGKYGTAIGPWIKISPREYVYANTLEEGWAKGMEIEVGTINAEVYEV